MNTIHVNLIGRFGNQMFQYAYARALSEKRNQPLTTNRWEGENIFDLPRHQRFVLDGVDELPEHYRQDQESLIYSRKQAKQWFVLKPEIEEVLRSRVPKCDVVCHLRRGDYKRLGYVVVSEHSYGAAMLHAGYCKNKVTWICEESPLVITEMPEFLPDFYALMSANVLFRSNSTFAWWAATLGDAKVYSPVIDGIEGGIEQECQFVEGNHPKFANLPMCTDLYLRDE